ncbi:MAG TPA: hypothetical protein VMR14_12535 [Streptosporangiaceae bacterium]|jgi:hypothetical protein|nr:hypothetical protein [Streptosporangiaceae bacterium]
MRCLIGVVLAAGAVGAALAIASIDTPARLPLVLVFLIAVPALAASTLLHRLDRLAKAVVAGTAAIVIDFGVAEAMIAAGRWSIALGVAAVALVSALIAGVGLAARRRAGQAPVVPSDSHSATEVSSQA